MRDDTLGAGSLPAVGPADAFVLPRFAGPDTFARLPRRDQVERCDVAIVGVPFDSASPTGPAPAPAPPASGRAPSCCAPTTRSLTWNRSGRSRWPTRATSDAIRSASMRRSRKSSAAPKRSLRALPTWSRSAATTRSRCPCVRCPPPLRPGRGAAFRRRLDTWDTYFGAPYTHDGPAPPPACIRRRAAGQGQAQSTWVPAGRCTHDQTCATTKSSGFHPLPAMEFESIGVAGAVERIKTRVGNAPVYISVHVDVLDPAHAPGMGHPRRGALPAGSCWAPFVACRICRSSGRTWSRSRRATRSRRDDDRRRRPRDLRAAVVVCSRSEAR